MSPTAEQRVAIAAQNLAATFASYPRRAVLDRCPHCGPPVRVDECDLFWLSIKLGNTVGDRDDVKALLPRLFESLVATGELDPGIVLGKLTQEQWRDWPPIERQAIDDFLDAVWDSLLAEFPSRLGAFTDVGEFLRAVGAAGAGLDRFLARWDTVHGRSADRHLAALVNDVFWMTGRPGAVHAWLRRDLVRQRLFQAFERDGDTAWADDIAMAYDLLCL